MPRHGAVAWRPWASQGTRTPAQTLDSQIDLVLPNVPLLMDGGIEETYEALLKIHQAIEILVAFYDTSAGLYVTLTGNQAVGGIKTFSGTVNINALLTLADAVDIILNTTTGSKLGTATNQKLGFWGTTPIIQPASANQAILTNSTTGSYDGVLANTTGAASLAAAANGATVNNNFTDVFILLNEMRTAMVTAGLMKGSA